MDDSENEIVTGEWIRTTTGDLLGQFVQSYDGLTNADWLLHSSFTDTYQLVNYDVYSYYIVKAIPTQEELMWWMVAKMKS